MPFLSEMEIRHIGQRLLPAPFGIFFKADEVILFAFNEHSVTKKDEAYAVVFSLISMVLNGQLIY